MATIDDLIKAQIQAQKPNPLQSIGAGLSGFAAPFLGQTWTPPKVASTGASSPTDMMAMLAMQQFIEQQGGGDINSTDGDAKVTGRPNVTLGESYLEKKYGLVSDAAAARKEFDELKLAAGKANIQKNKEIATQAGKASELTTRDYLRVGSTTDTNMQTFYKFAGDNFDKFKIKPGDYFGLAEKMLPEQWSPFKSALESSSKESSATLARALIPNMRALQGAEMFKGATAQIGGTLQGNINNTCRS